VFESLSDTPALEPSTDSDSDSDSDCEDDGDDVQYVYIPADSPFHRDLSTPCSAAHTSFTGFPFACDALAEEDPLFVSTPGAWFDEELQRIVGDDADSGIVVWDNGSLSPRSQCPGWPSLNTKDAYLLPEYVRQSPMVFDDDVRYFSFIDIRLCPSYLYFDRSYGNIFEKMSFIIAA
jgi:hypothetical protein